ncbi:Uncharacterized protein Adt_06579 [Abeliophyllum distichum]|uniref:Uncharacterized protein n=1 Tax=Abeliophyllum distichum TaxID=126358 RepID=A0ABD1V8P5_9LAMI
MSVLREFSILSKLAPVFYVDPHVNLCLSSNENVEASISSDTSSSIQLEVHQQGYFRRNYYDDLVGLDEWQEADGFTIVQMKKNLKVTDIQHPIKRVIRSQTSASSCS